MCVGVFIVNVTHYKIRINRLPQTSAIQRRDAILVEDEFFEVFT